MKTALVLLSVAVCSMGCTKENATPVTRVTLRRTGGSTFELIPGKGQPPFCLAFTVSKSGVTRQLTMSSSNSSFTCTEGKPVDTRGYKVPLSDGPVKVYTLFTSTAVNAGSIAQQIIDSPDRQKLSLMNMRVPGNAALDSSDFKPQEDQLPEVGNIIGAEAVDAGGLTP